MVNSCFKCGKGSEKDKDVTIFQVPIEGKSTKWQMEFLERLGVQDCLDKHIYICNRHFSPQDIEMKNSLLQLKENALPINTVEEECEEDLEIKSEVVFFKGDIDVIEVGADSMSDSSETRDLVPLEPLVEYMNVYEDVPEEVELSPEDASKIEQAHNENVILESEYIANNNGAQEISVISSEGNNLGMEPVMPFFLTSSPMFTIVNENNEVGETIILQIEEPDDKKLLPPPPVKEVLEDLHRSLCKSRDNSPTSTYPCDICGNSYGCLNCLKSHYETLHIFNAVRRYKCRFSHHVSRSLVCPVCERTFESRGDTMDHYITHSVGCEVCGSGFDRHTHLAEHYRTVHNKGDYQAFYECELCKMSYQYATALAKHYRIFHKMTLCHVCKTRFATVAELQEHERGHREKMDVLPFACSKCDMAFRKICDIAVHIRRDHRKETVPEEKEKTKGDDHAPVQKKVKVKK